jgi:hypothetical protein
MLIAICIDFLTYFLPAQHTSVKSGFQNPWGQLVLFAEAAGAGVLTELRRFFRRRSRILCAGAAVTFSQLRQSDKKTI